MLRYAARTGDPVVRERARRMADWELRIQLSDGGIQGGVLGAEPVAASTFVTGQVLFGWLASYEALGDTRYRAAAVCAGDFLLSCLDDGGRFVKGYSNFCAPGPKAYEVRTGWALAELGRVTGEERYGEAAEAMARYALACQQPNGWFAENDLDFHDIPLTHTLGYVLEGLLGVGVVRGRPTFVEAVRTTMRRLETLVAPTGFLAGRYRSDWTAACKWACLTGSAQIAGVALRLDALEPAPRLRNLAERLLGFVCATQLPETWPPGLRGGIHGSYPFDGGYGTCSVLNWATKFYADSLMLLLGDHSRPALKQRVSVAN